MATVTLSFLNARERMLKPTEENACTMAFKLMELSSKLSRIVSYLNAQRHADLQAPS